MRALFAAALFAVGVACAQNPMPGWMAPPPGGPGSGGSGCDSNCTGIPAWSAGTAYSQNAPVSWTAYVCFSSVAGTGTNTGHTPAAPPGNSYWGCYDNIGTVTQYIFNNFVFAE